LREERRALVTSQERFTVDAAVDGNLSLSDLRMDPATLAHQAVVASACGNPQLAENFSRAAELATIDDEEVMNLYEALRPHRSTAEELDALRVSLETRGASRCAELVRQAAEVYSRRGLLR
jgi:propanediol dehydratase small subunit